MKKTPDTAPYEFPNGRSLLNSDGSETPDPRPMALPVGFERPESIQDLIRRLVTDRAIRDQLEASGVESFDEADDFEVEDDFPMASPYEETFDPLHIVAREQEIRSGTVRDRSPEEKESAREAIRTAIAAEKIKTGASAPVPTPPTQPGDRTST